MIPEREGRQRDVVDVLQGGAQVLRLLTDIADRANQVSCKLLLNLETPVVSDRRAAHVGADELPAHSREAAVGNAFGKPASSWYAGVKPSGLLTLSGTE